MFNFLTNAIEYSLFSKAEPSLIYHFAIKKKNYKLLNLFVSNPDNFKLIPDYNYLDFPNNNSINLEKYLKYIPTPNLDELIIALKREGGVLQFNNFKTMINYYGWATLTERYVKNGEYPVSIIGLILELHRNEYQRDEIFQALFQTNFQNSQYWHYITNSFLKILINTDSEKYIKTLRVLNKKIAQAEMGQMKTIFSNPNSKIKQELL